MSVPVSSTRSAYGPLYTYCRRRLLACRGVAETEEWKKEEQRLVKELSEGAQGQEGTRLVSLTPLLLLF